MLKTTETMRDEIKNKYSAIPEMQISSGVYIHTIGIKYITILDTWGGSTLSKETIEDFYNDHF